MEISRSTLAGWVGAASDLLAPLVDAIQKHVLDGRKLHALVGRDGKTVAYLDIPPGLDLEAIGARRVGVRGAVHFNPELGTRLITVRDLEPVGVRR